jgi:uncharacterized protein YndB with AHSA1/START domain
VTARIDVGVDIDAAPATVWEHIADVERHVDWMHDATAIRVLDVGDGHATRFECDTRVGPLRLTDRMEITIWQPPSAMGVRHVGAVTGDGRFTLMPLDLGRRTRFAWNETLRFPWWLGGPAGAVLGARLLRAIWHRNLRALKAQIERG